MHISWEKLVSICNSATWGFQNPIWEIRAENPYKQGFTYVEILESLQLPNVHFSWIMESKRLFPEDLITKHVLYFKLKKKIRRSDSTHHSLIFIGNAWKYQNRGREHLFYFLPHNKSSPSNETKTFTSPSEEELINPKPFFQSHVMTMNGGKTSCI